VCDLYEKAQELHKDGVKVVSTDEKTGIQALERKYETKGMQPGLVERREYEYIRHGTQCLTANFEVATGKIVAPTIDETRTEDDFAAHIQQTVETDLSGEWVFIVDQLNTHKSESLVRYIAALVGYDDDLGIKGKSGILKNMKSRAAFLSDESHWVRFVYTPKHTSWLNQIEIWFSILARRLLKRASFSSQEELRARLIEFIEYFNEVMAKPFKWTYKGRPLQA